MATGALDDKGVWQYGEDDSEPTFSELLNLGMSSISSTQFGLKQVVTFTSSGTFTKASYPWLRAVRVRVQGGGGAGGGAQTTASNEGSGGSGGAGGNYSESLITDIAGLSASVSVTVGAGGTGVSAANGNAGGASSFGGIVSANGGNAGQLAARSTVTRHQVGGASATSGSIGDLQLSGDSGMSFYFSAFDFLRGVSANGGNSQIGVGGIARSGAGDGISGIIYGGGGSGALNPSSNATSRTGGAGADGIVIIELYA
jgi:hypothetical protein